MARAVGNYESILVKATVPNYFMTESFEFVFQMQHAAHEINDQNVIRQVMSQRLSDLFFEDFVPSFKISTMVDSCHDLFESTQKKEERAPYG